MPEAILTSIQLTDSFLPVGSYTASYGIIEDADDIRALITDYLRQQVEPCDMVAVRVAYETATADDLERLITVDDRLHAAMLAANFVKARLRRERSFEVGPACGTFLSDSHERVTARSAHGHFAVVLGALASQTGIDIREACLMQGYTFVSGLLGTAQRLLRLSHTAVQTVLDDLK